jgi:hypothetical protein
MVMVTLTGWRLLLGSSAMRRSSSLLRVPVTQWRRRHRRWRNRRPASTHHPAQQAGIEEERSFGTATPHDQPARFSAVGQDFEYFSESE